MAIEARIRELGTRHNSLDQAIREEMAHPSRDGILLQKLKRQKLRLKEEMESLRSRTH